MTTVSKYFTFSHLPEKQKQVSEPICDLAKQMEEMLPESPEKSAGMRKLLEAKDCFMRCSLEIPS